MEVRDIEIVADRTAGTRCDEGFLRVQRLTLRNHYADGSTSAEYACDVVSRECVDAVAVVIYEIDAERRVRVALKQGVRPPIYLRRHKDLINGDEREHPLLAEIVAGVLEPGDEGPAGIAHRAALECLEEAGLTVSSDAVLELGEALFASPGVTDEKVHYRCVEAELDSRGTPTGDGSVMEEAGGVVVLELREAIRRCRNGEIPDAKTEVGLLRLCDHLGYVPQLGVFLEDVRAR